MNDKINTLEAQIKEAATLYYRDGSSYLADSEFDALVEELRSLDPNNKLLSTPGWGYEPEDTEPHLYHKIVGIADKYKGFDRVYWKSRILPKFDGGSGVAYYNNGKLLKVLTRGDGDSGQNITRNVPCVPKALKKPLIGYVRGEVILSIKNFNEHFNSSRSIRNTAVGIATSKYPDPEEVKLLEFIPYKIYSAIEERFLSLEEICEYIDVPFKWKDGLPMHADLMLLCQDYPCDGLVCIRDDDKYEYAIKYNEETGISKINSITWNTKGTGTIFPTIHYDTLRLSDADCSNVSGGSYDLIKRNGYGIGAEIKLVRSGEVIPYIIRATKPSYEGINPKCSYGCEDKWVQIKGAHAICTNPECPCRIESITDRLIYHFAPKNFNYKMKEFFINEFKDYEGILTAKKRGVFSDIIASANLAEDFCFKGYTSHQSSMILKTIEAMATAKTMTLGWLVYIAEVKGLGDSQADNIIFAGKLPESIDEFNVRSDAKESWKNSIHILRKFEEAFQIIVPVKVEISGDKVCISGKLNYGTKSSFNAEIEKRGYVQVGSITSDLKILISNETNTGKCNAARKKGITIMTEEEFLKLEEVK